jgi:hypothetical protein
MTSAERLLHPDTADLVRRATREAVWALAELLFALQDPGTPWRTDKEALRDRLQEFVGAGNALLDEPAPTAPAGVNPQSAQRSPSPEVSA